MLGLVPNQGTDKLSLLLLKIQEKVESQSLWCAQLTKGLLSFPCLVPGSAVQLHKLSPIRCHRSICAAPVGADAVGLSSLSPFNPCCMLYHSCLLLLKCRIKSPFFSNIPSFLPSASFIAESLNCNLSPKVSRFHHASK